jgi:hypothetical protein
MLNFALKIDSKMTTDEYLNSLNDNFTVEGDAIKMQKPAFVPNEEGYKPNLFYVDDQVDIGDLWNKVSSFAPYISTYQDTKTMIDDPSVFNGVNLAISTGADVLTTASILGSIMTGGAASPTLPFGTAVKTGLKSAWKGLWNTSESLLKPAVNFMAKENGERILTNAAKAAGRFDKVYDIEKGLDFARKYGWQYGRNTSGRVFSDPRLFLKGNHYMDLTKGIYGLDATLNLFQNAKEDWDKKQQMAEEMQKRNEQQPRQSVKDKTKQVFSTPPKRPTTNTPQRVPTMKEAWESFVNQHKYTYTPEIQPWMKKQ